MPQWPIYIGAFPAYCDWSQRLWERIFEYPLPVKEIDAVSQKLTSVGDKSPNAVEARHLKGSSLLVGKQLHGGVVHLSQFLRFKMYFLSLFTIEPF
jgi:hypothetical protein